MNALGVIIGLQGIDVVIKSASDDVEHTIKAAQSNYFRAPLVDENIVSSKRSYVISSDGLTFVPERGDKLTISEYEYYSLSEVQEMRFLGKIIGYRLFS